MLLINDLVIIATEIRLYYRIHWPSQAITAKKLPNSSTEDIWCGLSVSTSGSFLLSSYAEIGV